MNGPSKPKQFYYDAKGNKWFRYFAVFCRIALALGFIPSGIVKIMGERFTGLSANHPLGHYFDALQHTGYYYTSIGVVQLITALLLLIPRTALLGAVIYFPIIVNICVLAYATRFEGTRITTLMLLANVYLLCWDYERLKHIVPFKSHDANTHTIKGTTLSNKFPWRFFGAVFLIATSVVVINHFLYEVRPGNSAIECSNGCVDNKNRKACEAFCDCIHNQGKPLDTCLKVYQHSKKAEKIVSQDSMPDQNKLQEKIYSRAIAEYINAAYKKNKLRFDTLFFGKNEAFPNIEFPPLIENVSIVVMSPAEAEEKLRPRKSFVFINLIGTVSQDSSEFIFNTFTAGFRHHFDCFFSLTYNATIKKYELQNLRFEDYIFNKKGKLERIAIYEDYTHVGDKPLTSQ